MRYFLSLVLCLVCSLSAADPEVPTSVFRFQASSPLPNNHAITSHGVAWTPNLSDYSRDGTRYVLTVAHLLEGRTQFSLELNPKSGSFTPCHLLYQDPTLDIAILVVSEPSKSSLLLASVSPEVGAPINLIGSPKGRPTTVYKGNTSLPYKQFSTASISFDHGQSGAPVLDPGTNRVLGMASRGLAPKKGAPMDPNLMLFIPASDLKAFLSKVFLRP